jgi:hypothetical protein
MPKYGITEATHLPSHAWEGKNIFILPTVEP